MAASDTAAELASLKTSVDLLRADVAVLPSNLQPRIELCVRQGIDRHVDERHRKGDSINPPGGKPAWVDPVIRYVIPALVAAFLGAFGMKLSDDSTQPQTQHATQDK